MLPDPEDEEDYSRRSTIRRDRVEEEADIPRLSSTRLPPTLLPTLRTRVAKYVALLCITLFFFSSLLALHFF